MKNIYFAYLHSCWISQLELTQIFEVENSAEDFYRALNNQALEKYVKNTQRRQGILDKYRELEVNDREKKKIIHICERLWVEIICLRDTNYPENLKNIPHTPFILYVRWSIPEWDMFWVVWSRKISEYGKKVIQNIVPEVSQIFPIVSGGAAGCDTFAHKVCLDSWNPTVVVVWTGIDQTYPVSNEKIFNNAVQAWWAIISIFRIWEPGNPYNFPVRNEIVVWLSIWVLVVEAAEKSWSLITSGLTLDLWKDLFSVPGDIFSPNFFGSNRLIKKWEAKCVTDAIDILEEYDFTVKKIQHKSVLQFSDKEEEEIYNTISLSPKNIDDLSNILDNTPQELIIKVSMLELKGVIKKDLIWKYQLV